MRFDIEFLGVISLLCNFFETPKHKDLPMMIIEVVATTRFWNFTKLPDWFPHLTEKVIRPHVVKRLIIEI